MREDWLFCIETRCVLALHMSYMLHFCTCNSLDVAGLLFFHVIKFVSSSTEWKSCLYILQLAVNHVGSSAATRSMWHRSHPPPAFRRTWCLMWTTARRWGHTPCALGERPAAAEGTSFTTRLCSGSRSSSLSTTAPVRVPRLQSKPQARPGPPQWTHATSRAERWLRAQQMHRRKSMHTVDYSVTLTCALSKTSFRRVEWRARGRSFTIATSPFRSRMCLLWRDQAPQQPTRWDINTDISWQAWDTTAQTKHTITFQVKYVHLLHADFGVMT